MSKNRSAKNNQSSSSYSPTIVTINNLLPDDCLLNIFSRLSIAEKVLARRVCQRWRHLIQDQMNHQKVLFFGSVDSKAIHFKKCQFHSHDHRDVIDSKCVQSLARLTSLLNQTPNLEAVYLKPTDFIKINYLKAIFSKPKLRCVSLEINYSRDLLGPDLQATCSMVAEVLKMNGSRIKHFQLKYDSWKLFNPIRYLIKDATRSMPACSKLNIDCSVAGFCNHGKVFYKNSFVGMMTKPKTLQDVLLGQIKTECGVEFLGELIKSEQEMNMKSLKLNVVDRINRRDDGKWAFNQMITSISRFTQLQRLYIRFDHFDCRRHFSVAALDQLKELKKLTINSRWIDVDASSGLMQSLEDFILINVVVVNLCHSVFPRLTCLTFNKVIVDSCTVDEVLSLPCLQRFKWVCDEKTNVQLISDFELKAKQRLNLKYEIIK